METAKKLLTKSTESGTEYYLSLLNWPNTPTEGMNTSPVQRMFGRKTRTQLTVANSRGAPNTINCSCGDHQRAEPKMERKTGLLLQPTCEGTFPSKVRSSCKSGPTAHWQATETVERKRRLKIRSYRVGTEDGRVFRRNRRHLRCSKELFYPSDITTELQINPEPQAAPEEMATKQSSEPQTLQSPPREQSSTCIYLLRKVQSSQWPCQPWCQDY